MSIHPHKEREYCINGFKKKILSISRSRTNGHPAVVPMVTALNHVVADGRRAGGLNLSSSILTDYRERVCVCVREREKAAGEVPPSQKLLFFWEEHTKRGKKKINSLGVFNWYYTDIPFFQEESKPNPDTGMWKNHRPVDNFTTKKINK